MTPEAGKYLAKAQECLDHAHIHLRSELGGEAGRSAYLTAFHSAQALIFERTGKVAKTHQGVHSQFGKLAQGQPLISTELRQFLGRGYNLKTVADYNVEPGVGVSLEQASAAIATAQKFLECVGMLLQP